MNMPYTACGIPSKSAPEDVPACCSMFVRDDICMAHCIMSSLAATGVVDCPRLVILIINAMFSSSQASATSLANSSRGRPLLHADKYVLHRMLVFSTFAVFPAWGDVNLSTQASFCHAVAGGFGVEFESDTLRNGTSCDRPGLYVRRQI